MAPATLAWLEGGRADSGNPASTEEPEPTEPRQTEEEGEALPASAGPAAPLEAQPQDGGETLDYEEDVETETARDAAVANGEVTYDIGHTTVLFCHFIPDDFSRADLEKVRRIALACTHHALLPLPWWKRKRLSSATLMRSPLPPPLLSRA
jgi:hypothetical protein